MAGVVDPKFEAELRRGLVQLVALHFLEEPRYGYDLVRLLSAEGFPIEEGTLYPILRRFEKQGILSSRWDTAGARPRKYYEISAQGRETRAGMLAAWLRARKATDQALHGSKGTNETCAQEPTSGTSSDGGQAAPETNL